MSKQPNTKPFYNSTIPNDWTTPEFGEVFSFLKSFSFSREQLTDEKTSDAIQNIHYGDIHATFENEILDFEIEKRIPFVADGLISKEVLSDEEFPLLKDGDLIIADALEDYVGVAECVELRNVNGRKIVSGLHTFAARDKNGKTAAGYRTYILNHPQVVRELRRIATGFSVFGVSKTNLAKVKLPLPPHKEQQAIADLLHLMDEAINANNLLIEKKELQKKWLMQNLLTGTKRLKGFDDEWREVCIGDVGIISSAGVDKKEVDGESRVKLLNYLDVYRRDFIYSNELNHWVTASEDKMRKCDIRKGDIFFTPSSEVANDIAISAVVMEDVELGVYSYHIVRLRLKENWDLKYRAYAFKTSNFFKQAQRVCAGSGQRYVISQDDFRRMKIKVPSISEQEAIGNILFSADNQIQLLKAKTINLREKKKALMQLLLTGKKRLLKTN